MVSALAVDIGGTKLDVGVVDAAGVVLVRERMATRREDPWPGVAALIDRVLAQAAAIGVEPSSCGVGCGGPMERGGGAVSPLNIPRWRSFPLHDAIARHTGLPTTVDNDAKALALAEGWLGAAAGVDDFIGLVVSTGVGGGIVLDGRLLDGASGNAGHIGHVVVVPGGRPCACGGRGCLEAEASGTSIAAITGVAAADATPEVIARTGTLVGRALAAATVLLDLSLAVVAGSVALGFGEPFFAAAQRELDRLATIEFARGMTVRPGGLGSDGPLVGAAALALRPPPRRR
ncbi:MAG: ROK family protein [Acidimicrobiia bacterium]